MVRPGKTRIAPMIGSNHQNIFIIQRVNNVRQGLIKVFNTLIIPVYVPSMTVKHIKIN